MARAARPKVLVLTPDFPPSFGGIQRLIHGLVHHWKHVQPFVVTLGTGVSKEFDTAQPFAVRRVPDRRVGGHRSAVALLNLASLWHAFRFRPDVVLSGHVVTGLAAWVSKWLLGVPYVQYLHGREVAMRPRLSAFAIRHAFAVVAVSRHTADMAYAYGAAPEQVYRVPPGVDLPPEVKTLSSTRPTIVTVARLAQRYKGHDVLIRALPLVCSRVPGVRLMIVGDGPLRPAYEALARTLDIEERTQFLGALDDDARDRVLDEAQVFAMPSRLPPDGGGEGFGIAYLEASARGLPVVAGNVAGALDAVADGETGLLVDPCDHVAVADALSELLADPEKARVLGRAGRERAKQFAWSRVARHAEHIVIEAARS